MKNIFLKISLVMILIVGASTATWAANKMYMYRSRANWVKLDKLSKKQLAGERLAHPFTNVTTEQMEAMLMSIKMGKGSVFKKELKTDEVFNEIEARKFAAHIVKGLSQAAPNQVINVSVIHKRPYFLLRNDYVSNINVYVTDQGVHFYFNKLFARLDDDYQQASNLNESLAKAKSLRVSLQPGEGQKLTFDGSEIVMSSGHDYTADVAASMAAKENENKYLLKAKSERKSKKQDATDDQVETPVATKSKNTTVVANSSSTNNDVKSRLQKLDELHKSKLITDSEYQQKKKEILSEL